MLLATPAGAGSANRQGASTVSGSSILWCQRLYSECIQQMLSVAPTGAGGAYYQGGNTVSGSSI
jgi:hypothetical protein